MNALTSVLIVEPSDIIVEGVSAILNTGRKFNMLSPLHDADSLEQRLPTVQPDIVIVNPTLMGSNVRQRVASLGRQFPSVIFVALVYQYVEPTVLEAFRHHVDIRAGRSALLALMDRAIADRDHTPLDEPTENYELSDRETDVLVLIAKGLSSKEIADTLNISIHTVNSHRKNITHKTGIKSVAGLAVYAMIHNLMD